MPTVSILILTYNSSRFVDSLLSSVEKKLGINIEDGSIEIVVVDNNSTDDTVDVIRKHSLHKKIRLFENDKNLGYAAGINFASKKAKGEFLVIINPDSILEESDFTKAIEYFDDNKIGICGFRINDYNDQPESNAGKFYNILTFALFSIGLENAFEIRYSPSNSGKVDYVSGGFMMIRRDLFEKLSGFDEKYFMYVEDMDICFRARKSGYKILFSPVVILKHKGQGSSNRTFAIVNIYKGLSIFYKLHGAFLQYIYVRLLLMVKAYLIIVMGMIMNKPRLSATYKEAVGALQ